VDKFIETNHARRHHIILALATGILFGCSFPPFPFGVLASVSLVPLLLLIERLDSLRKQILYSYFSFFIASCIALYWVGGFTVAKDPFLMLAGGLLLLWEPIFFSVIVLSYIIVRKSFGIKTALIAFPFLWITGEWLYALGEFAFPWLTLGNTQTYQLDKIQFADITGVYGISFWLVILNVLAFVLLTSILKTAERKISRHQLFLTAAILLIYIAPSFYTGKGWDQGVAAKNIPAVKVGIVQPNIDPWEKWDASKTSEARWAQVENYLEKTGEQKKIGAEISVWPETAILYNIPLFREDFEKMRQAVDSLDVSIVSGYINCEYYPEGKAPAASSVIRGTDLHYDSFNSIMYLEPHSNEVQSYEKMRLVPFAERIPYASAIPFLIEPLRWGVGISNWGIGTDSTVFEDTIHRTKFLAMVCYESIFPEFVSAFVKRGAQFLVFITNDSWWGNTSGARQHSQYAILRAVENRRWVVRCANGGISCFIDPYGNMYDRTAMYTQASVVRSIQPLTEKTFYTEHGDWIARIAGIISALFLISTLINVLRSRMMKSRLTDGK